MPHDPSDKQLVRRFQRGDTNAFTALVQRHQDRTLRLAYVWLDDSAGAEDVVQEVFLRAWTGLHRFRFSAAPATWLFRMTRNVCNEMNRRRRRKGETAPGEVAYQPGAEREQQQQQTIAAVRRLVAALPERQRDAVLLRVFEELSVIETARVMGCRPGTVKATLHKALNNLRAAARDSDVG
ncbi:MAG: sigma-70 family RNA polymerase sigma factor [Gammaproteobacteria bacterium]|nr:sigma-70 family RNA polymerase sigma factor [Gammaproteobacteria bacterium]NNM20771.1 sigma-70 family RNA polymerase sigma factor [Gammaproteobacteria bacterium]